MDIPLGVAVHCKDGRCGRSTHIILNPATEQVTHIVVRDRRPSRVERLVPIAWIEKTAAEVILLNHTREEYSKLERFRQTEFVYTDIPLHVSDPKLTALWPYVTPTKRLVDADIVRISPGELAVRRGTTVRATDGRVGRVDEFILGPLSGNITHLVMRQGQLRGESDVCIPVSHIDRIQENVVYLSVDKQTVKNLPGISVIRRWR